MPEGPLPAAPVAAACHRAPAGGTIPARRRPPRQVPRTHGPGSALRGHLGKCRQRRVLQPPPCLAAARGGRLRPRRCCGQSCCSSPLPPPPAQSSALLRREPHRSPLAPSSAPLSPHSSVGEVFFCICCSSQSNEGKEDAEEPGASLLGEETETPAAVWPGGGSDQC